MGKYKEYFLKSADYKNDIVSFFGINLESALMHEYPDCLHNMDMKEEKFASVYSDENFVNECEVLGNIFSSDELIALSNYEKELANIERGEL